ncbi:MAG: alpha-1,2-fucosyltransferase [Bacteroidales bacterium]
MKKLLYFQGGLGNQMFQYAFYLYLQKKGISSLYVNTSSRSLHRHNGFELFGVFPRLQERPFQECNQRIISWFLYLLYQSRTRIKYPTPYILFEDKNNNYKISNSSKKYIWIGFWQKNEYVEFVENELRSLLVFNHSSMEEKNFKLQIDTIQSCTNSVSIHIRRGDYLQKNLYPIYGTICTANYYKKAIEYISSQIQHPVFFIFSDDIPWAKENLGLKNACYMEGNSGINSFKDMQLMSLCQHNIIANSSFSWWAAWLNVNQDKIVLSPDKWYNIDGDTTAEKLIPKTWIRIDTLGRLRNA